MKSIFSKIIDKELPCYFIAENDYACAFMDINPIAKGHTLVVPKMEVDYLFSLDNQCYNELWKFTKLVANALKKTISCKRIAVSVIGLEVPHAHIHLIPINDMNDIDFSNKITTSSHELQEVANNISNNISN